MPSGPKRLVLYYLSTIAGKNIAVSYLALNHPQGLLTLYVCSATRQEQEEHYRTQSNDDTHRNTDSSIEE